MKASSCYDCTYWIRLSVYSGMYIAPPYSLGRRFSRTDVAAPASSNNSSEYLLQFNRQQLLESSRRVTCDLDSETCGSFEGSRSPAQASEGLCPLASRACFAGSRLRTAASMRCLTHILEHGIC